MIINELKIKRKVKTITNRNWEKRGKRKTIKTITRSSKAWKWEKAIIRKIRSKWA